MWCTAALAACSTAGRPGEHLQDRVGRVEVSTSFTMEYRATGTGVLDCFLPNRAFILDIRDDTVVARRPDDPLDVLARRSGESLELAPTLFEPGLLRQRWLTVELPALTTADRARLVDLLGVDLASYLMADGPPPHGQEIAVAALDSATDIESMGAETIAGEPADRYRITLDPERYADAQASESSPPVADGASTPGVDIWVDGRDDVVRVAVSAAAASPGEAQGWVITFGGHAAASAVTGPTVPIGSVDLAQLSAATVDCEL